MVETTTKNYGWTKPEITKSASTWGGFLNTDLDSIDSLVWTNQQGIVPIGSITMFGGATAPANWLFCQGQSLSTTAPYDKLFAVLQYVHGGSGANFNLPNLQNKFPLGVGPNALGSVGGTFSYTIAVGNLPAHAHPIVDVAHSHTITDQTHSHTITIGDPGHTHSINVVFGGGSEIQSGSGWGQHNINSGSNTTGITGTNGQSATGITGTNPSGTGLSTTQNTGSGTPLTVVPPCVALNFIIRFS